MRKRTLSQWLHETQRVSDTRKETVTLYIKAVLKMRGGVTLAKSTEVRYKPAGEFRRINWCKTHDSQEFAPEEGTKVICLQAVFRYEMDEDDGSPCELIELWQEQP